MSSPVEWQSTGGIVDPKGLFITGAKHGSYFIEVRCGNKIARARVVVKEEKPLFLIVARPRHIITLPRKKTLLKINIYKKDTPIWVWPWEIKYQTTGGIVENGKYTAPWKAGEYKIILIYKNVKASIRVTVRKPKFTLTQLQISPREAFLISGQKKLFHVYGFSKQMKRKKILAKDIQWFATGGTINQGFYEASDRPGKYTMNGKIFRDEHIGNHLCSFSHS